MREILAKARNEGWALGAFNAGNLEIAKAIVQAAQNQQAAVILETSAGEASYFGMKNFLDVVENFRQQTGLTILTNFDHGPGLEECLAAIEAGYNLVHFDGSNLPYEENVKITKALVAQAHQKGILIEGEIDKILGESQYHEELAESIQATANYTDPQKAADFVENTGVDILAVFVGNIHGAYQGAKKLDLERLALIRQAVGPNIFFSLHGGSTLSAEDIKAAIRFGVVKVNVNTELRLAYRETLENVLRGSDEVAIYKIMPPVIAAVQKVVEEKIELFKLT
ncbi:MAG: class II fructose-bisphosphate aldolase [Microgenomates group bacterium]